MILPTKFDHQVGSFSPPVKTTYPPAENANEIPDPKGLAALTKVAHWQNTIAMYFVILAGCPAWVFV